MLCQSDSVLLWAGFTVSFSTVLTFLIPVIYDGNNNNINWFHCHYISIHHLHININKGHDSQLHKYIARLC